MTENPSGLMGSGGGIVEADETYVGRKWNKRVRPGHGHKETVFSLVQRGGGVRSVHITGKTFAGIKRSLKANVSKDAVLMTDDARMYKKIAKQFADHKSVNHSAGEYVRGRCLHQHRRRILQCVQAWHDWCLPALQQRTFAPLPPSEFAFRYKQSRRP